MLAIIESAPTALVMIDCAGRIVLLNAETERLFGYRREALLGQSIEILVPERFRGRHADYRTGYLIAPEARTMGVGRELYGIRQDGSEFPIEIGLNPVETGEGVFVLSAIVDISERKESEVRFRQALESAPMAMIMIDDRGIIDLANTEAGRLFGYPPGEMIGQSVDVLVPDSSRGAHPGLRTDYFKSPNARRMGLGRELYGRRKDGSQVPVEIGLSPLRTAQGRFVLSAIVDISERKRAEEAQRILNEELERRVLERTAALERSHEALERSNVDLQQFAYIASHDLQTPLRGMAGCAQLLEERFGSALGQDGGALIRRIVGGAIQLQSMIKDLLEYSKIDSRERPFENISLDKVFTDAIGLLYSSIQEAGARVTKGELPWVRGDRAQLTQLMTNLIGNAVKYHGSDPPRVHVTASLDEGGAVISVRDNGIGIAAEHQDGIFEAFRRLHTQQSYPGTGIGLAVCRRVVARHGGRIWVESALGSGSTFHFTLSAASRGSEP